MISVEEAEQLINQHSLALDSEVVPLTKAGGKILQESLVADRDFPPFDRVTMDGIAIRYQDWKSGTKNFSIMGIQPAGSPQSEVDHAQQTMEVMTGAILPKGTDTVVPYEMITTVDNVATINGPVGEGQNVHKQGTDRATGAVIVKSGVLLGAAEIGIAATVGKASIEVVKPPKVAVISTGDELVSCRPIAVGSSNQEF